jgi:acyl-coenzyme A thioesterase PaaI-like protein
LATAGAAAIRCDGSSQSGYKVPNDPNDPTTYLEQWQAWAYATPKDPALAAALAQFRVDQTGGGWDRVDDMAFRRSGFPGDGSAAIAASLGVKAGAIPAYRMFLRRDGGEVAVVAQLARGATGHPGILHGGVTALLFDEGMGWMTAAYRLQEQGFLRLLNDPNYVDAPDIRKKSVREAQQ